MVNQTCKSMSSVLEMIFFNLQTLATSFNEMQNYFLKDKKMIQYYSGLSILRDAIFQT
jgi:hypothetical protein